MNALLLELLKKRELEIVREKEQLASQPSVTNPKSRYIRAPVRQVLAKEHGSKCSAPHCLRDSKAIHHTQRFGLNKSHDPHFLAPLCKEHHLIAHSMDTCVEVRYAPGRSLREEQYWTKCVPFLWVAEAHGCLLRCS